MAGSLSRLREMLTELLPEGLHSGRLCGFSRPTLDDEIAGGWPILGLSALAWYAAV